MTSADDKASFQHSRVYAQGWNAARRSSLKTEANLQKVAASNPYESEPERTRWNEGFAKGTQ